MHSTWGWRLMPGRGSLARTAHGRWGRLSKAGFGKIPLSLISGGRWPRWPAISPRSLNMPCSPEDGDLVQGDPEIEVPGEVAEAVKTLIRWAGDDPQRE